MRRQADVDDVDRGIGHHAREVGRDADALELRRKRLRPRLVQVADIGDGEAVAQLPEAGEMRGADPGAHDRDPAGHAPSAFICARIASSMTVKVWRWPTAVSVRSWTSATSRGK